MHEEVERSPSREPCFSRENSRVEIATIETERIILESDRLKRAKNNRSKLEISMGLAGGREESSC